MSDDDLLNRLLVSLVASLTTWAIWEILGRGTGRLVLGALCAGLAGAAFVGLTNLTGVGSRRHAAAAAAIFFGFAFAVPWLVPTWPTVAIVAVITVGLILPALVLAVPAPAAAVTTVVGVILAVITSSHAGVVVICIPLALYLAARPPQLLRSIGA